MRCSRNIPTASRPSTLAGSPKRFGAPTIKSTATAQEARPRAQDLRRRLSPNRRRGPLQAILGVLAQLLHLHRPFPALPPDPLQDPLQARVLKPGTCCPPFGSSPDSCRARSRRPRRRSWTRALTYSRAPARWSIQSERSCGPPISGAQWRRNCARSPPTRSSSRSPKRRSFSAGTGAGKRGRTSIRRYNWCGCCSHASASGRFRKSSESSPRRP